MIYNSRELRSRALRSRALNSASMFKVAISLMSLTVSTSSSVPSLPGSRVPLTSRHSLRCQPSESIFVSSPFLLLLELVRCCLPLLYRLYLPCQYTKCIIPEVFFCWRIYLLYPCVYIVICLDLETQAKGRGNGQEIYIPRDASAPTAINEGI